MKSAAAAPAPGVSRRFAEARHAWELLYLLTRRDLKLRYQDTILGFFWTAIKPLLFGLVVWFALHKVLNVETDIPYHLFLLSALLPWTWFQASIMFATPLFANNGSLVKKVPFPSYVLPLATISNNMIHFVLSLPVLIIFLLLDGRVPGPEWLLGVPLLLLIELALMTGLALFLSAMDVHFRDLEHLVEVVLNLLGGHTRRPPHATRRHSSAAFAASKSPPESRTWSSWASSARARPSPRARGQKANRPLESRFWHSQKPRPS